MIIVNKKIIPIIVSMIMLAVCLLPAEIFASSRQVVSQKKVAFKVKATSYDSVRLTWNKKAGKGAVYKVYRARGSRKFVKVASVKGSKGVFKDRKLKTDQKYRYKIVSVKTETEQVQTEVPEEDPSDETVISAGSSADADGSSVSEGTKSSSKQSAASSVETVTVRTIAYSKVKKVALRIAAPSKLRAKRIGSSSSVKIRWKSSRDAAAYKLYRSKKKTKGYRLIDKLSSRTTSFKDRNLTSSPVYYYKVKAVRKINGKEHSSRKLCTKVYLKYRISGDSSYTAKKLAAYFNSKGKRYPAYYRRHSEAKTIRQFTQIYVEECKAENIKPEVAFAQCMLETGWLTFRGDVSISQYNFAGLGATGGVPGNSFRSIRVGIRAHIQHLKAYASKAALNKRCVDPRFTYVTRGTCKYVEWLGIYENPYGKGWAATYGYGADLLRMILAI